MNRLWREYEIFVFNYVRSRYPQAHVLKDLKIKGVNSGALRQVDILIVTPPIELNLYVILECKYFNKKIDVKIVDSFLGFLQDVKASKGILVSNKGFTSSAIFRAHNCNRDVELWALGMNTIKVLYDFCIATVAGQIGMLFNCPIGWHPDEEPMEETTALFPNGLTLERAKAMQEWIHILIQPNSSSIQRLWTLDSYLAENNVYSNYIPRITIPPKNYHRCDFFFGEKKLSNLFYEYIFIMEYRSSIVQYTLYTTAINRSEYLKAFKEIINSTWLTHETERPPTVEEYENGRAPDE